MREEYTAVILVRGEVVRVTRPVRADAEAIADRVRQTGRWCGWPAEVVRVIRVRRAA